MVKTANLILYIYTVNAFDSIRDILEKPFPQEEDWKSSLQTMVIVSIFITFFLYIFTPFDMNVAKERLLFVSVGFGLMTFFGALIFDLFAWAIGFKSRDVEFTFGKWLLYMVGIIFTISLANFLFVRLYYFGDIKWEFFIYQIKSTFLIGLFPVVGVGLWTLLRKERKYKQIAGEMNAEKTASETDISRNDKLSLFGIKTSDIRYVEALQNYVKVGYIDSNGDLKERTERATLKDIIDNPQHTYLERSHRSFLVNKDAIISASGNAQGLMLTLADTDRRIPVSRSRVNVFRRQ